MYRSECFLFNYGTVFKIHSYKVVYAQSKMIVGIQIHKSINQQAEFQSQGRTLLQLHRAVWRGFLLKAALIKTRRTNTWIKNTSSLKPEVHVSKTQSGACLEEDVTFFKYKRWLKRGAILYFFSSVINSSVDGFWKCSLSSFFVFIFVALWHNTPEWIN